MSKTNPHAAEGSFRRRPQPVGDVTAGPALGEIELSWAHADWEPLIDHYVVYGAQDTDPPIAAETVLDTTVYSRFAHTRLGPQAQTWTYRIVVVDAAGRRSRPSQPATTTTLESVVLHGEPVAEVGVFDGKSFELALAPDGYAGYPDEFPDDVDFVAGEDAPDQGWCYTHPGPNDRWAGSRAHTFTLRFDVNEVPGGEVIFAFWLIDAHRSNPGTVVIGLNGQTVAEVNIRSGVTRGHVEGNSTAEDSLLRPSYEEIALPTDHLTSGRNVLTIDKVEGSYHVYDAVGVFTSG